MLNSVRARLTLWYVSVLSAVLIAFSGGLYELLAHNVRDRFEAGLREAAEATSVALARERAEGESRDQAAHSAIDELYFPLQALAIYESPGRLIAEKTVAGDIHASLPPPFVIRSSEVTLCTLPSQAGPAKAAAKLVAIAPSEPPYLIVAAQSPAGTDAELALLRRVFFIAIPLAIALAATGGWFLARKSLAPVAAMSAQARRITAENLDQRLPVSNPRDELGRMAAVFNELLDRLNASFQSQREFMADASHELRTPLSVMRTAAEVTLEQEHRAEPEYRESLSMIRDQTKRLARIVGDMLILAHSDAGQRALQAADFYLDETLSEVARAASLLAAKKGVAFELAALPEAPFRGDEELIRQLFFNLFDNAVKYTPEGGAIRIALRREAGQYFVSVSDTGSGIPPQLQPRVFERFFRAGAFHSPDSNGNGAGAGLGLSIARWIAEAHHGSLTLARSDSSGSTFAVTLPASKSA